MLIDMHYLNIYVKFHLVLLTHETSITIYLTKQVIKLRQMKLKHCDNIGNLTIQRKT